MRRSPAAIRLRFAAAILAAAPAVVYAQEPALADVLARAGSYVTDFSETLSGAVAEERYDQFTTIPTARRFGRFPNDGGERIRRTLRSDYLLVRPVGEDRYYGFRDVFEVDGRPVRDREQRLSELFLNPSASADA